MVSQLLSPKKAVDSSIMAICPRTAVALSKMQDLKSFTLRRRSFFGHSRHVVGMIFA